MLMSMKPYAARHDHSVSAASHAATVVMGEHRAAPRALPAANC